MRIRPLMVIGNPATWLRHGKVDTVWRLEHSYTCLNDTGFWSSAYWFNEMKNGTGCNMDDECGDSWWGDSSGNGHTTRD